MKKTLRLLALLIVLSGSAQDSTRKNPVTLSGYAEVYYSYDLSNPGSHQRPPFFYNFNRHNEFNLNLGYIKGAYTKKNVRGNLAIMTGTYAQYNLSSEHPVFQHLLEGNVGLKLSRKRSLWLDAGVMPAHIGFESATGKDCWTLSRSLCAENSPYYESGVKIGYTSASEKFHLAVLYLNGWQHIQRLPGNQTPAFGTQLTVKPNEKFTFSWNTFIGNEKPDTVRQWRYFNNFYAIWQPGKKFGLIAGFDIGWEQKGKDSSAYNTWYTPVLIVQYRLNNRHRLAARGEYYSDEHGVIIATGTPNGFQTAGYSINYDFNPDDNVLVRFEARGLSSRGNIFILDKKPSNQNYFFTASVSYSF